MAIEIRASDVLVPAALLAVGTAEAAGSGLDGWSAAVGLYAVEIQPPLMETRMAILRKKVTDWKVRVDDSVLGFLAEKIRTNVRRLEGDGGPRS